MSTLTSQQLNLEKAQWIDIRIPAGDRCLEHWGVLQESFEAGKCEDMTLGQPEFGGNPAEHALANRRILHEAGIMGGNMDIGFGHGHHCVINQALKERPLDIK